MSGDVQPRKRKDKKRRKDDASEEKIAHAQHSYVPLSSTVDDINIHVHHEGGTGGGICAKIIFFLLFSALAVLVGLIIIEHRGLTELDTVNTESRFSQIFEGWVDNSHGHEDDHSNEILDAIDDHDEEHDDEHDEELDHEEEEDEQADDEDEHEEEDTVEQDEDEEQTVSEEVNEDEEDEEEENVQEYDQVEQSEEQNDETQEEDEETLEEVESEEQPLEQEEDDVEEDVSKAVSDEEQNEEENDASVEQNEEEDANDDEEVAASSENKETIEEETKDVEEPDEEVNEENAENSNMAVKLGVGVALLIVAHVVLIRKWKSASNETTTNNNTTTEQQPSDLSRRNTIVVPPSLEEIEQDLEEYSEGDDEMESDAEQYEPQSVKTKYEELRTTYVRSLTPDFENKTKDKEEVDDEEDEIDDEEEIEEEIDEEEDEEADEEEDEYAESDNEDYNDDEDDDLLQRLEAKYGKIQDDDELSSWKRVNVPSNDNEPEESESDKQSDDDGYEHADITSKDDFNIKEQIDDAQKSIEKNSALAIKQFNAILNKYPSSPRSIYGKALALDNLADQKKSNEILRQALKVYLQLLQLDRKLVPDVLFLQAAEKCINRMRFLGLYSNVEYVHKLLIDRFPDEAKFPNDLAVSYLTINRVEKARQILKNTLSKWPNNGFALVHYGFILKTTDNNLNESVIYLRKGMSTREAGVNDGRFYFHLGDALTRLGRKEEAFQVYEEGVKNNVFLSKYQRSLYNVNHLTGKAWWNEQDLPYKNLLNVLKNNYKLIRDEGLSVLNEKGYFQDESENLRDTGDWKQFELFARGQKNFENCKKTPYTCKIVQSMAEASGCKRGQTKFSVMHAGTHVWPHCGPTNCRLRIHLGLKVPENTFIRVAEETRSWEEGEILIFDDSFEHEVWHNGTSLRLVLIVDVWHPELSDQEKRSLSPI